MGTIQIVVFDYVDFQFRFFASCKDASLGRKHDAPSPLHPVMDASLRDAGVGGYTICYRAIIPTGFLFATTVHHVK